MTSPKHAEVSDPSINVDQLIHQIKNKDITHEEQDPSVPSHWICRLPVEPILRSIEYKWKKRLLSEIAGLIKNMHAKE